MKIVKISELSDDEKKKWKEQVETRASKRVSVLESETKRVNDILKEHEKRKQERTEAITQRTQEKNSGFANRKINLPVSKEFEQKLQTGNRVEAPEKYNLPTFVNNVKKNALPMIAKNTRNDLSKAVGNLGYGLANGLISAQQAVGRTIEKQQERDKQMMDNWNSKVGLPTSDERYRIMLGEDYNKPVTNLGNKIEEQKQINTENIQKNIDTTTNPLTKKVAELTPSIGQMLPGMLLPSGTGALYFTGSAKGNYYDEAIQRGMSEEEADKYSGVMALIEGGSEAVGAHLTKGVGKNILKGNAKGAIKSFALDVAENVGEEAVIEPLSELTTKVVAGDEYLKNDYRTIEGWKQLGKDMLSAGIDGGLVAMLMGGASAGIGSSVNIINKINNGQKININELNIAKQDVQNKMTDKQVQQKIQEAQDIINDVQNKPSNTQTQQITQKENKTAQNETSEQINDMLNNKKLPMQNYQYEKSNNVKINNLRQDANKYFNNSEKARNYVNMLEKIITDKNIDIRLDANLKTADGRIANGSYSNGVITINPNSTRAGEFIAIHELTHAIGTKEMINMINTYRQSNTEFDTAVKGLLQNYEGTEISEEALSDISAQLFGNQEFINNIAQNNPNIFQKLYSEIKYLWHQFRGYKNQNQFVEDLYYKWTQAYNSNNKFNQSNRYYIETIEDFDEMKYNNAKEIKLPKREYAILSGIVNSDSNIKPGRNYVETTNATYEVYFKETGEFKVVGKIVYGGYNDTITNGNIQRIGNTGNAESGMQVHSSAIQQSRTGTRNDEISNFNQRRTRISDESIGNGTSNSNNVKYSIQESENNSGSFNLQKNRFDVSGNENLANAKTLFYRTREDGLYYVQATDGSGKITYDGVFYGEKQLARSLGEEIANKIVNTSENTNNEIYLQSDSVKNETDYMMAHRPTETGAYASNITKGIGEWESLMPEDVYEHPEWYFDMNQEYSKESFKILKQIKNNPNAEITIYRATTGNKINKGDWVTLSKKYAEYYNNSQFNGKGNIVELKVKAKDVQYAGDDINEFGYFPQVNTKTTDNPDIRYSQNNETWKSYLDKNYKPTGTRTSMQDILPTKEYFDSRNENNIQEYMPKETPYAGEVGEIIQNNKEKATQEKIANILIKPQEKVKEKDRSWAIIKANLIDKGMVFEELSRKANNRDLQGKWDYTLTSEARGQNAIGNARYELDPNTKTQKQISKSLTEIIDEVGEDTTEFYNYMYHQLNIDRMTLEERFGGDTGINYERKNEVKNKPVFGNSVTAQMSKTIVEKLEKQYPEFKEYAQDVYDFLDANIKELVNNGVISKETQELFKEMYPHYVPISRVRNKGEAINVPLDTGRTGINSPIKKATGGSSDINPLFETMANRTLQTYRASARNSFGVELKNTINKFNQLNQIAEMENIDTIIENMTDEEQNKELLQEGKNGENPTFTVFENGNKVTYEIDKDMYDALKPKNELLSKIDNNKVSKIANKINNFRRGLLTEYNPVFSITNPIKDIQDVLLNSQHSAKTYAKIPEATAQILSKGYWYNEYIQNGGKQNSYFKDGEFETTKKSLPLKLKNTITFPLRAISSVNNVIEMTPRLAEYIVSRQQGRSIETSMLDASRVTTNFKAGGDITKTLNRNGFTFLNASIQGMQQQIRNVQEANAKGLKGYAVLACKYAIAGVPVLLLNNMIWNDDEEYKELQDYVKDNYYIIGKLPNGKFLRIPKGRAVATIQKIVSNANEFIKNDSINSNEVGKIFWEDMKENIQFGVDNLAPNNPLENNVVSPIIQAITNKTWYGDDLVPTRLQDKPVEEQYDETTDKFSRWLGEQIGVSPIKINYLLDQYSGGVGDVLLPLGTPQAENNVIEDKFTTDAVMKNKYPGEFYEKLEEITTKGNSDKATDKDILQSKYANDISSSMGDLYKEKREIQNSNLSDEEKKDKLKIVQKQINDIAKNGLSKIEDVSIKKNTATIGKKQYYKVTNLKEQTQEWRKLSDEELEKNKNISLITYADYKEKIAKETINQRKNGIIKEDANLKDKDKISILLNSQYNYKEKQALYENYIKSKDDKKYDIIKDTGLNINSYLKYKLEDNKGSFDADRKDDGTEKGKAVYGSSKKKKHNYISNMQGTNYIQRLILFGLESTPAASDKKAIVNYVFSRKNKTNKEKREMLKQFSWITFYQDGSFDI